LALFGRRLSERGDGLGMPASENLHMNGHGAPEISQKEKAARRRLLNSNLMIADQAAINAGFDFRR
jgi:hypothetical protein